MNYAQDVLALIALRDAQDSMQRALGWTVAVSHVTTPGAITLYGHFSDSAPALCWAADFEAGLNDDGETGFRCIVTPVMPAL